MHGGVQWILVLCSVKTQSNALLRFHQRQGILFRYSMTSPKSTPNKWMICSMLQQQKADHCCYTESLQQPDTSPSWRGLCHELCYSVGAVNSAAMHACNARHYACTTPACAAQSVYRELTSPPAQNWLKVSKRFIFPWKQKHA